MAKSGKKKLRAGWLKVHKWIGLLLAVLIIPVSLTGSALVWHDWLDAKLEPQRYALLGPATLPASAYEAAARKALEPGERLSELRFNDENAPVLAIATMPSGGGRPQRTSLWLDPRNASVIDRASSDAGPVRFMHVLHGSLMIPGGWGRPIVGWVGVFMLLSCISGIWLWWPLSGNVRSGFRWKRRNTTSANLHYMTGFWILFPLAMLSFTGAWISFPKVFSTFEAKSASRPAGPNREQAMRARPLDRTATPVDAAVRAAQPLGTGDLVSIGWPTDQQNEWRIGFARKGGPAIVPVVDGAAIATPPPPPQPETLARVMRRWHDGTGMGLGWQIVIFLGGIIPALLSITGIIIWWRSRNSRARAEANRRLAVATG